MKRHYINKTTSGLIHIDIGPSNDDIYTLTGEIWFEKQAKITFHYAGPNENEHPSVMPTQLPTLLEITIVQSAQKYLDEVDLNEADS